MIAPDKNLLLAYGLGVAAVGCALYVLSPYLSGEIKAEKRRETLVAVRAKRGSERVADAAQRRKQVSDSLKEVEQRGRARKLTVEMKIAQAGLGWTRAGYYGLSGGLALLLGLALLVAQGSPVVAAAGALVGGLGVPSWILSFLKKRRLAKFIDAFPNAVDVVVRGIKAGLPLADCLRVVAAESPEPLKGEFRRVVETQAMGLSLAEAVEIMAERVPVAETNFFSIVIGIQSKAGGNLSEALANLSKVIRDRKKMRAKVKAISAEAKASAGIIGSLPFAVGGLIYVLAPDYISLLFTTSIGHVALGGGAIWMSIGIFIMKKMISFTM